VRPEIVGECMDLKPLRPVVDIYTDKVKVRVSDCPVPLLNSIIQQVLEEARK
jgi:hypothetical protein